ncbi:Zn(II)2Cys6 transcription factor [Aspergillus melleus]|uniref:Zn(II)2Cys6 transcription factor n=1 Tax=Aspergillus melleus TaxID=138277 RepID=UPI001E8DF654|nr:uncharacterized protein LDX57_004848 [Aspergillus melleus]KAH8427131.1 hypothetical protein LDX57_004848 [Aspergillus melleus]
MRQIHGVVRPPDIKHACAHCRRAKSRCQGGVPCSECLRRRIHCSLDDRTAEEALSPCRPTSAVVPESPSSNADRSKRTRHFLYLYFEKFHPHWLFIHQGSFDEDVESPFLIQAMVVIGLWMSDEPDTRSAAIEIHNTLAMAISQQRGVWDVSIAEDVGSIQCPISTYQAILLHIIFALMQLGGANLGIDLKPSLTQTNADLLNSLVRSCKARGLLYYPQILSMFSPSDSPPYLWLGIEEIKRFNLALYKVYRATSSIANRPSDTHRDSSLTARELQFPLPVNTPLWKAVTRTEWDAAAHVGVFDALLDDVKEGMWISRAADAYDFDHELCADN